MTTPKLSDRELDARIAVIDGWTWWVSIDDPQKEPLLVSPDTAAWWLKCISEQRPGMRIPYKTADAPAGNIGSAQAVPRYSSSLDALAPVVKKTIEEKGDADWVQALLAGLNCDSDEFPITYRDVARLTNLPPRQIAEAVVRCWE